MDALKAELAKKRKAAEEAASNRPTKYMKRGDLERMKLEEEAAKKAASKSKQEEERRAKSVEVRYLWIICFGILTDPPNRHTSTTLLHQLRWTRNLLLWSQPISSTYRMMTQ
jgi:DNA-binding PucR family transcriptional regulator